MLGFRRNNFQKISLIIYDMGHKVSEEELDRKSNYLEYLLIRITCNANAPNSSPVTLRISQPTISQSQ